MVDIVIIDGDEPEEPHQVGYKKPPREHQFKPGGRGGPGRPKGSKSFKNLFHKHASSKVTVKIDGKTVTLSAGEAMIMRLLREGIAGNSRAIAQAIKLIETYGLGDESPEVMFDYSVFTTDEFFVYSRLHHILIGESDEWLALEQRSLESSNETSRIFGGHIRTMNDHAREEEERFDRVLNDSRRLVAGQSVEEEDELSRANRIRAAQGLGPLRQEDLEDHDE